MTLFITLAFAAGLLVSLSRQINGRLSLSTSPLRASFWNHLVGLVALTAAGLAIGGLFPPGAVSAPWHAYIGGPIGVVFVAASSWLIGRIGAVNTALLVIGGQMVSGVAIDMAMGVPGSLVARIAGVILILGGMLLTRDRAKPVRKDG